MITALALSQALSASSLTGVRAALAILVVALAGRFGGLPLPPELAWLCTDAALAALVGVAAVEELGESDEDLQELLEIVHYGVRGSGGFLVAWSFAQASPSPVPEWVLGIVGGLVAGSTHHLRVQLHEALRGFGDHLLSPRSWLVWLERGGVVGVGTAVILAPGLALAFVLLAAAGAGTALVLQRQAERRLSRRPCPHCGHAVRKEASRCPSCGGAVEVLAWRVGEVDRGTAQGLVEG